MLKEASYCTMTLTMTVPWPESPIASATALIVSALRAFSYCGKCRRALVPGARGRPSDCLLKKLGSKNRSSSSLRSSYMDMSYGLSKYSYKVSSFALNLSSVQEKVTDSFVWPSTGSTVTSKI